MAASSNVAWYAPKLPSKIPSLDGLRAVSILLVLFSHAIGTRNFPVHYPTVLGAAGELGVRIFFIISGFLITTLLLKELSATDRISLQAFYLRRTFRIFPASYAYITVIILLVTAGWSRVLPGDLAHAATYTMNYHHPHAWIVGHLWSLSVEEQFYLLWPAVLVLAGPRRATLIAVGAVCVTPLLRFGTMQLHLGGGVGQEFHLTADALATGCLLAAGHRWLGTQPLYLRILRSRLMFLAPVFVILLSGLEEHPRILALVGYSLMNLAIALSIDRVARFPHGLFGRLLNAAPVRFVGLLSYSLYLWQQVFLDRSSVGWFHIFPINIVCVCLAATASYYVVERPFLRIKDRLSAARASRSGEPAVVTVSAGTA